MRKDLMQAQHAEPEVQALNCTSYDCIADEQAMRIMWLQIES